MKVCSTFHGFVLDLHEKVLENVLRECSQFCCGEDPIVAATKQRAFAKTFMGLVSVTYITCSSTR